MSCSQSPAHHRPVSTLALESAIAYIQGLDLLGTPQHSRAYAFEHGIVRACHLLHRLGGAPRATTRCVLVAGSKGKGSTANMIAAALGAAGYRVGVFTGPHLHTPLERFTIHVPVAAVRRSVADGPVRDSRNHGTHAPLSFEPRRMAAAEFIAYAQRIRQVIETWDRPELGPPTRFEAFTAMAYRWFEEQGVDLAVMEIGIGGRHDAVNLAEPIVSVITNISLEHTQMLGSTLAEIAYAKAGILRAGGQGVVAPQQDEARQVILAEARRLGIEARLHFAEACCALECTGVRIGVGLGASGQWLRARLHGPAAHAWAEAASEDGEGIFCSLLGHYQLENAATAITALLALTRRGYCIHYDDVRRGFADIRWPGRFQVLRAAPLVIADGAHTPYSMEQLCASLRQYFPGRAIHFIIATLRDKDSRGIIQAAMRAAASITFTDLDVRRATPAAHLYALWQELRQSMTHSQNASAYPLSSCQAFNNVDFSLVMRQVLDRARPDDVVCVTGSLSLVSLATKQHL